MRAPVALALLAGCHEKPSCVSPAQPLQDAAALDERAYREALAAKQLEPVALTVRVFPVEQPPSSAWPIDTVFERELAGTTYRVVAAGTVSPCVGPRIEYVKNGSKIFRAIRKPTAKHTRKLTACGCAPPACGGALPPPDHIGYELPQGATFEGTIDIAYEVSETVYADYVQTCPPPP